MDTSTSSSSNKSASSAPAEALLYVLHSGKLFGTERMAISTLIQLGTEFDSLLLAPQGGAVDYAITQQVNAHQFCGMRQLIGQMTRVFLKHRQLTLIATGISHSLIGLFLATLFGVQLRHIHVVHGGTDERLSYGRKKWLRWFSVEFIAVSEFVKQRMIAHEVPAQQIHVIENFLKIGRAHV